MKPDTMAPGGTATGNARAAIASAACWRSAAGSASRRAVISRRRIAFTTAGWAGVTMKNFQDSIVHASSFSRGKYPPSFASVPSHQTREAERRQALGCSGTRFRAGHSRRPARVPAQISFRSPRAGGRSPLGAPPRRFFGPEPALANLRALLRTLPERGGVLKLRIAAFAGPARSGGRAVSLRRLPGARLRAVPAGRRIPLRLWLVSGDALGERDDRHIIPG